MKSMIRRRSATIYLGLTLWAFNANAAGAPEQILCSPDKHGSDVIITLDGLEKFGRSLNCISGSFISDMTPCAPNGGYGLSAPTGYGALVGVVDRWQDYSTHFGGVTSNFANSNRIYFSGGVTSPYSGYREQWTFSVSRLTGSAELKQQSGISRYHCRRVVPKF